MRERGSSVLHGVRSRGDGKVVLDDFGIGGAGENLAQNWRGGTCQEMWERFGDAAMRVKVVKEPADSVRDFAGDATIADGARDGSDLANTAADAEIVGVDHLA